MTSNAGTLYHDHLKKFKEVLLGKRSSPLYSYRESSCSGLFDRGQINVKYNKRSLKISFLLVELKADKVFSV